MSKKKAEPATEVEVPVEVVEEHRAPEEVPQLLALAKAEAEGKLPDEDRRAPEGVVIPEGGSEARVIEGGTEAPVPPVLPAVAEAAPLIPNNAISVVVEGPDGTKRTALGSILE